MKTKKIQYLNIIKTISIFLVVFCHIVLLRNNGIIDNICMLICWIAVPCFFLVNGAILLNKELNLKKHYKKVLLIYVINIIWRIIYLIIYITCLNFNIYGVSKVEIIKYLFFFGNLSPINISHFYFIEAMLAIYIIFPIIHMCFNNKECGKKYLLIMVAFMFAFTYVISAMDFFGKFIIENKIIAFDGIKNAFIFGTYGKFLIYFILGGFLHVYKDKIHSIKRVNLLCIVSIIISIVMLVLAKYVMSGTFEWKGIYLQNGYDKLATFAMSISTFIILQNIKIKNKILSKVFDEIGTSTLGIFYIHIPLLVICNKYLYEHITYRGVIPNIIKTIVVIITCYIIVKVLKKIPVVKKIVT